MWMRSYRKNKYFYPHPRKMKIQLKILSGGTLQDLRLDFFYEETSIDLFFWIFNAHFPAPFGRIIIPAFRFTIIVFKNSGKSPRIYQIQMLIFKPISFASGNIYFFIEQFQGGSLIHMYITLIQRIRSVG